MREAPRFTWTDGYRTVTSVLMVVLGGVILARTLSFGVHLIAVLVGGCFVALGVYRLSFVVAYLRRRRSAA
ncbi:MAG TPA: hypothetical protein VEP50_03650 [bacterium]|nr:hypothetical protein [bacterium]